MAAVIGFSGNLGSDLGAHQAVVERDVFLVRRSHGQRRVFGRERLVLEDADGLGHAVFFDVKILRRQSGDEVAILVFHHDGFDDELGVHGEGEGPVLAGLLVSAHGLRGGGERAAQSEAQAQAQQGQPHRCSGVESHHG